MGPYSSSLLRIARRVSPALTSGVLLLVMLANSFSPALADPTITIKPNAWNVIGLDSNSPTAGPYRFPIGARVCNTSGSATTVTVDFHWDDGQGVFWNSAGHDTYINLRTGSLQSLTLSIDPGSVATPTCLDAFFEVEVAQINAAYDKTRRYYITATDSSGTVSTLRPRELYVEHLISQNRNAVTGVDLSTDGSSYTPIPAGGTMTLLQGNTYWIKLDGGTATQGYNQFEDFINFPNTIFQILAVTTNYSADSNTAHVPNPNPGLYADACTWDSNPNSPTYRSCIGGDDKAGGSTVTTVYKVKILSGAGTSQTLNTLLYDFSGSSYHYNADFSAGSRVVSIVGPSSITIKKAFSPKAVSPNSTTTLTFTLTNPTTLSFSGLKFTDTLPTHLTAPNGTTPDVCGIGSSLVISGNNLLTVADGSLAPNSSCSFSVTVTADGTASGDYVNTTSHLFIDTTDTTNFGQDTLSVATAAACTPNQQLARWTVPSTATAPPDNGSGIPSSGLGTNVSSAVASLTAGSGGGGSSIDTTGGVGDSYSWKTYGFKTTAPTPTQVFFKVDTSKYSSVVATFYAKVDGPGPDNLYVDYTTDSGATYSTSATYSYASGALSTSFQQYTVNLPSSSTTWLRLRGDSANNDNSGSDMFLDDIRFTGCAEPSKPPTLSKAFSASLIPVGSGTSTLTFTIANTQTGNTALTNVSFTDPLPSGLRVVTAPKPLASPANYGTTGAGCTGVTFSPTAGATSLTYTATNMAAGATCTAYVDVEATTSGTFNNVTGFISSTQSGQNKTSSGYGSASLRAIAPPVLAKSFSPTSIFTSGSTTTSTLTFTITNPNSDPLNSLSGIAFTDTIPDGVTVATAGATSQCGGSLSTTAPHTIAFTGGSLAANASCSFTVTVTGASAGLWTNTTNAISSTEGGTGNQASASISVADLAALIDLTKQVSTTGSDPWTDFVGVTQGAAVYYRFKVYNSGFVPFTALNVTDATLSAAGIDLSTCTWSPALPLAPGDTTSCIKSIPSAAAGTHQNTATVTGTYATGTKTSAPSTAQYATTALTIAKSVAEPFFVQIGDQLHYTYVVTNPSDWPLLGPVTVTDNKITLPNSVTCPDVSTVGDLDSYLDKNESVTCSATYVVVDGDITAGLVTNRASASADGVTSNTDSKTVPLAKAPTVSKAFGVTDMLSGGTTSLTVTIGNANTVAITLTSVLTDTLPSGMTIQTAGNGGSCSGVTATAGAGSFSVANGTSIPVGGCTVIVTITSSTPGQATNTIAAGALQTTAGNNASPATASLNIYIPPTVTKSFDPTSIYPGQTSKLTLTLGNPSANPGSLTGVQVDDTFPTGVSLSDVAFVFTPNSPADCGTVTRIGGGTSAAGDKAVHFTVPSLAKGATCQVELNVSSSTPGGVTNNTETPTASGPVSLTGTAASAALTVSSLAAPTVSKGFSVTDIATGGTANLTVTIGNPNPVAITLSSAFTDTLPTGMTLTSPVVSSGTCTGLSATGGDNKFTLASGTSIPATVGCTVVLSVTSSTPGTATNSIAAGDLKTSAGNNLDPAVASLNVYVPPVVVKAFSSPTVKVGGSVTMTLTLSNPADNPGALTGLQVDDPFPTGMTLTDAAFTFAPNVPADCGTVTSTSNAVSQVGDANVRFKVASLNPDASCEVSFLVTVTGTAGDTVTNNTLAPTATGPVSLTGDAGSAGVTLTALVAPTIDKSFNPTSIPSGDTSDVTFTLSNSNNVDLTGASFTDTLTDMQVSTAQTALGDCARTDPITFGAGDTSLSFSGLTIPANGSCTVIITVTSTVIGVQPNRTSGLVTTEEPGPGAASNIANLTVIGPPSISKAFSPASISVGDVSTLTFTIANPNAGVALTGVAFTDDLSNLVNVATPSNVSTSGCGSPSWSVVSGQLVFSSGDIAAGGSCTASIDLVGVAKGTWNNTSSTVSSTNGGTGNDASDNLTIKDILPPVIAKAFSPGTIFVGDPSTLTFTITNPTGNTVALTGVGFTDTFPTGMVVAATPNVTNSGCGTPTITPGTASLQVSGATVAVNGTCTITVDVTATAEGSLPNQVTVSSTNGGTGNTDSDTLTANPVPLPDLTVSVTNNATLPLMVGDSFTWTFQVNNQGSGDAVFSSGAMILSAPLPTNANYTGLTVNTAGATNVTNAGNIQCSFVGTTTLECTANGAAITLGSSTGSFTLSFTVTTTAAGPLATTGTVDPTPATVPESNENNNTDTDSLTVLSANPAIDVTKTLTGSVFSAPNIVQLSYSIVVSNTGDADLSAVQVTDDLVATYPAPASYKVKSLLINATACPTLAVNSAYDGNGTGKPAGDDQLLAHNPNNNTLPIGASCTITLVVQVDTGGEGQDYLNVVDASGNPPSGEPVTATASAGGPNFIDPALTKAVDPSQAAIGDEVTYTITVTNNGNVPATGVIVTDVLPDNLDYVSAKSVDSKTKLPRGTVTLTPPRTVKVTLGTVTPEDKIIITIVATVNGTGQPPIENKATLVADPPGQGTSGDPTANNTATAVLTIGNGSPDNEGLGNQPRRLPSTGFAPGVTTVLPPQPAQSAYRSGKDVWLEIPKLKVHMPVVGIPFSADTWDVTWLSNQAGWLQGTAFPTWNGNSVLTGHVYLANGLPGPFLNLGTLAWGDQVIVHLGSQRYIYQVQTDQVLSPSDTSALKHETVPWLTLITCKGYNQASNTYASRVAVRAVLVKVESDNATISDLR